MKKRTLRTWIRRSSLSSRLQQQRKQRARALLFEQLESRRVLTSPWQNMSLPNDVDANGQVNVTDANIIQNMLIANGGNPISVPANGSGPPYPDANGDWVVNMADWQQVNSGMGGGGPPPGGPPGGIPPTLSVTSSPGSVNEMQVFTITGTFTWAYYIQVTSPDSEYVMIGGTWDPPNQGMSGNWTMTGYFRDDNGSNTSSDTRTLRFEDGNNTLYQGVAYVSVTVNNVSPSAVVTSDPAGFNEGSPASITVNVLDGSNAWNGGPASDAYGFEIDWGDGHTDVYPVGTDSPSSGMWAVLGPSSTLPPAPNPPPTPGYTQFGFSHIYKDEDPTGTPQDYYTVHVTVIDDDTGVGSGTGQVLIKNVKPSVAITSVVADDTVPPTPDGDTSPGLLEEGERFKVFGIIGDAGVLDTHDGVIKADSNGDGDMDDPGESLAITTITPTETPGEWTFEGLSPPILDDGPSNLAWESNHTKFDDMPIRVEIYDDDMVRAPSGAPVGTDGYATVNNVPPKIQSAVATPPAYDANGFPMSVVVDVAFTDVGVLDCHKARLYFSDNTFVDASPVSPEQHSFTFYAQTTNANNQPHWPTQVTVYDDDSGQDTAPVTASGVTMWVPDAYASETKAPGNVDDDAEIMFTRGEGQAAGYEIGIFFQLNRQADPANPDPSFADVTSDYTVDGAVQSASDPTLWYTTIPFNAASASIRIVPVDDQVLEWDEKVVVRFGGNQKIITIFDNEGFGGLQNRNLDRDSTSLSRDAVGNGAISVDPYEGQFVYGVDVPGAVGPSYNGDDNLHPLLPVEWQLPPVGSGGQAVPTVLYATSNFGGLAATSTTFNVTSQVHNDAGKLRYLVSASDASSLSTGHYDYNIKFTATYSNDTWPRVRTLRGSTEIVNTRDATHGDTAFGAGWRLDELDKLVPDDGNSAQFTNQGLGAIGGQALVRGDNTSAFFPSTLDDKTVNSSPVLTFPGVWLTGTYAGSASSYKYTNSSDNATWTINNLKEDQQYQVFATWVPGPSRSQSAHYKVKDQAVGSPDHDKTITVDQRYTPGEVTDGGLKWRSLGYFTPDANGKIIVELSGTGGEIVAQSVMVVKTWTFDKTPLGSFSALTYEDGATSNDPKHFVLKDKFGGSAQFDGQGLQQQREDRNDNVTKYEYLDATGDGLENDLKKITRQGGLETSYAYDSGGHLKTITDFSGRVTDYTIDSSGKLNQIQLPAPGLGNTTRPTYAFGYSGSQLNSIKDPGGSAGNYATSILYASGRVSKVTNPDTYFWQITPFLVDGLATGGNAPIRKPATGLIGQREIDVNLSQSDLKEPRATYTDGRTNKWYYQTDTFGLTTALAKPAMNPNSSDSFERRADVWRWERRSDGLPTKSYEPAGGGGYDLNWGELTTTYSYGPTDSTDDKFGNLREIDYPDTTVEKWEYDPTFFLVTKHIDPLLFTTRYVLDYSGNVADIFENDSGLAGSDGQVIQRRTHFVYTPAVSSINQLPHGLLKDTTVAYGTSDAVTTSNAYYDQANDKRIGLLKSVTYAVGTGAEASMQYDYDDHRNPESVTDELLHVTQFIYDDLNRVVYTQLPDPGTGDHLPPVMKNTYDLAGNLIYAAPSSLQGGTWDDTGRIRYDYDKMNRVEWEYPPVSTTAGNQSNPFPTQYVYDGNGNVKQIIVAGSRVTDLQYDGRDELIKKQLPQPSYSGLGTGVVAPSEVLQRPTVETKYDALGNVRLVTDPRDWVIAGSGKVQTKYLYDKQSQLIETRQPARSSIEGHNEPISKIEYDDAGRIEGTLSPGPDTSGLATVASGRGYDSLGRLEREIMPPDALGRTLVKRYAYDLRDNLVSVSLYDGTNPLGIVTTNFYDARDRLVGVDEPDPDANTPGLVTLSAIDAAGNTRATLTYAGNTSAGNVVSGGAGPSAFGLWFQYGVLAFSNIKAQLTQFGVDNLNRTVQIIAPDPDEFGPQWSVETDQEYDALGHVRHTDTILHENGGVTTLSSDVLFDNRGQAYHTYGPANADGVRPETITHFNYDGTVGSIDEKNVNPGEGDFDATWRTTYFSYDDLGRQYKTVAPGGLVSYTFQDALDNVVLQLSPDGQTVNNTYDVLGRLATSTSPIVDAEVNAAGDQQTLNSTHKYLYFANGLLREDSRSSTSAATGSAVGGVYGKLTYGYDALGRLNSQNRESGGAIVGTEYVRDVLGNVDQMTDATGDITWYQSDNLGRQTEEMIHVGSFDLIRRRSYDAFGNLTSTVDRNGQMIEYTYDNAGHRLGESWLSAPYTGSSPVYTSAFTFDSLGQVSTAQDSKAGSSGSLAFNSIYEFGYTGDGRLSYTATQFAGLPNRTFTFDYTSDLVGRRSSRTVWDDSNSLFTTSYAYDDLNRPLRISESGASVRAKRLDFAYAGALVNGIRRYETTSPDMNDPEADVSRSIFTYSADGRLNFVGHYGDGVANNIDTVAVHYDFKGLVARTIIGQDGSKTFQYDQLGQLVGATDPNGTSSESFNYDADGNRIGASNGYDRITDDGSHRFVYDNEGNVTQRWTYEKTTISRPVTIDNIQHDEDGNEYPGSMTQTSTGPDQTLTMGHYRLRVQPFTVTTSPALGPVTITVKLMRDNYVVDDVLFEQTLGPTPLVPSGSNYTTPAFQADFDLPQNESYTYLKVTVSFPTQPQQIFSASGSVYIDKQSTMDILQWDYHNRLQNVEQYSTPPNASPNKLGEIRYEYDVLGNLVARRNIGTGGNQTGAEFYVSEGGKRLLVYDDQLRLKDHFLNAPDVDAVLAIDDFQYLNGPGSPTQSLMWALSDQNGTVRDLYQSATSQNSSPTLHHITYDAFGSPGGLMTDRALIAYLGMPWDQGMQIYWRGSRPYDPFSGRYLSPSTSGFAGGTGNAYVFENNTPTSRDGSSAQTGYVGGYDGPSFWDEFSYAADPRNDFARGDYVWGTAKSVAYVWGAAGAAFIGTYIAATAGVAAGASATTAWATAGTGAALGATSGVINTYASNPEAGLHEYAFGAGLGGAFGAANLIGSAASLVGGGTGAAIAAATGNNWRTGYQIGDLAGGMLGGGIDDGVRAYGKFAANGAKGAVRNAVLHGAAHFGVEAGFAGAGAAIGGYATGTTDGALFGANMGSMVGGAAANFLVACFTARTPVLVSIEGHSRLAQEVRKNDMLIARDENNPNGPLELKRVEEVFTRQSPIVELVARGRIIGTTAEHPFFLVRLEKFVPASHMEIGDAFLSHDGQLVVLDAVRDTGRVETVYNFRIADHHTYFVGGSEWGFSVWCHNARYQGAELAKAGNPIEELAAARTGIARNVASQERIVTKAGREFILDFKMHGDNGSIAIRNTIMDAKGGAHTRLSGRSRRQIRAMMEQAELFRKAGMDGVIPEIVSNYKPQRGEFATYVKEGLLKFTSPDDL